MAEGRIDFSQAKCISVQTYNEWTRRLTPEAGDLILAREAPVGGVVQVPEWPLVALGQRTVLLRPDPRRVVSRYLHFLLRGPELQHSMLSKAEGSTVPHLNVADVRSLVLPALPSLPEQHAIAELLGALDDKIESNRRLADLGEQLLRELSGSLEELPLVPLSELAAASREPVDPGSLGDASVDLYSLPAFDAGRRPERCLASSIKSGKFAVAGACILVSRLNPGTPRTWFATRLGEPAMCSTEFLVLHPRENGTLGGVWLAVQSDAFQSELVSRVTGTSGSHQRVKPGDAMAIHVPDIREASVDSIQEADGLLKLVRQRRAEAATLGTLRDVLLPEVLSGRLRVRDAVGVAAVIE